MKNTLLMTTALLGVAMLAQPAAAELQVKAGGYISFQAGFFDTDLANSSNRDFRNETEVQFRAEGRADNGLEYGGKVDLQVTTGEDLDTDEVVMYIAGNWGRVELGDEDGASDNLTVFAPTVGLGQHDGEFDDWMAELEVSIDPLDSGDSTKVTYYTPRFAGLQAGISYAPEFDSEGEDVVLVETVDPARDGNTQQDVVELGLNYERDIQGVGVTVGGGWVFGDAKPGSNLEDVNAWSIGAQLAYAGFKFGGGWVDDGDSNQEVGSGAEVQSWNIGLSYENGPMGVAVSYVNTDRDGPGLFDTELTTVGGIYTLAPGLAVEADVGFFDTGDSPIGSGYLAIIETRLTF